MVSDEGDSTDVISSIIISRVETVAGAKATSPISTTSFVEQGTKTETAMDFDNKEFHSNKVDEESDRENEENDKETPTTVNFPTSSSSFDAQEADLETSMDSVKCENHSILYLKSEREDEESNKGKSTVATLPVWSSSLVGQRAIAAAAIHLDSNKNHNVFLIKEEEDEGSTKEIPAAANLPYSSNSLVGQETNLETSIDLDKCENHRVLSPTSEREDEESDKENSTAAISFGSLVGQEANTATAIDLNGSKSDNVSLIKEDEQTDKVNSTVVISPVSSTPLVGNEADTETVVDSYDRLNHSVPRVSSDKEDEKSDKKNSTAVLKTLVNSTVEPSEGQGESSRQFEAHGCDTLGDTPTNSQKYQDNPVISDRITFKCKLCSFTSTIRFGLKRHIATHSENSDLNKIKFKLCPFKAKSKKRLSNHLLVRHKNEKLKYNICDTFVLAHLKEKHLLKCKKKQYIFECKKCQYKTIYERMFKRHQKMECSNKRRSIPRQSEASRDQCGELEKSKQRWEQLHRCEYCSYSTEIKRHLKKHILLHTVSNKPIYRCSECEYKSTRQSLSCHMMMTHGLPPGTQQLLKSCNFCSYTTKDETRLGKHIILHTVHNRPIYRCPKCDYKSTKKNFSKHVKDAHKIGSQRTSSLAKTKEVKKCDFCSYTTKFNTNMIRHHQLHTVRNEPIISCTKCDYKAPQITLTFHYTFVHGPQKDKTEYTCKFCSFTTHVERNLRLHTRFHTVHNRPIYPCPKCDYKSIKKNVEKHVKNVHKIQSIDTNSLKKTHTGKQAIALSKKNKLRATTQDVQKWSKQSNTKINENEGEQTLERSQKLLGANTKTRKQLVYSEYSCERCSFTTKFEAKLNRHLRIHKVQNGQCNKSTEVNVIRHSHIHRQEQRKSKQSNSKDSGTTGIEGERTSKRSQKLLSIIKTREQLEQPYICDFCSFTTKFEPSLIRHLRLHSERNERIYSCSQCDYKATKLALRQHLRIHRGEQTGVPERKSPRRATPKNTPKIVQQMNRRKLSNEIDISDNEGEEFVGQSEKLSTTRTNDKLSGFEYGCDLCSFTTNFEQNLDKHLNLHEVQNEQILSKSSQCEYKSTKLQLQNVTTRSRIVHREKLVSEEQNGETKVTNYRCQLCSFTTKMADAFERHGHLHEVNRATVKTGTPLLSKKRQSEYLKRPAETANKRLSGNKLPEINSSSATSELFHGENNTVYACEICDYTTNHKQNLFSHKSAHLNTKALKAKSRATPTPKASAKKGKYLKCSTCRRCFNTNQRYRLHVCEEDTDEYTVHVKGDLVIFKCRRCSYRTMVKQSMKRHCRETSHV